MKIFKLILSVVLISLGVQTTIFANSAPVYWKGYASYESMVIDENTEVEILHEDLTFDFTEGIYDNHGIVTAKYMMHNTSNQQQTIKMAFPFLLGFNEIQTNQIFVTQNEKNVPTKIYLTNMPISVKDEESYHYEIDYTFENIASSIKNGYIESEFIKADTPCKRYTFKQSASDKENNRSKFAFSVNIKSDKTKIVIENFSNYNDSEDEYIGTFECEEGYESISILVFGDDIDFKVTGYFDSKGKEVTKDFSHQIVEEELDPINELKNLAKERIYDNELKEDEHFVSQVYNQMIRQIDAEFGNRSSQLEYYNFDSEIAVIYYEVEFLPDETIPVSVSYITQGSMNRKETETPLYQYLYLFEPAKYWKDFGDIDISVRTSKEVPFLVESSLKFTKYVENMYSYYSENLPLEPLEFSLHDEETVDRMSSFEVYMERSFPYILVIISPFLIIICAPLIFVICKKTIKNKRK